MFSYPEIQTMQKTKANKSQSTHPADPKKFSEVSFYPPDDN